MWRGVSVRKLLMLIVGPMLVETLHMLIVSWMLMRTVAMGYEPLQQMWVAALASGAYAISSFTSGRWVTRRIAPWLMIGSILGALCGGLTAVAIGQYWVFLIVAVFQGACIGHYYVPFQVNMVHVRPFRTVAWSVAFYNVAWGTGAAVGPFLGAWFEKGSVTIIVVLAISLAAAHTMINLLALTAKKPRTDDQPTAAFESTAIQRVTSRWCFFAVGTIIRGLYATLWPYVCLARGWSEQQVAWGMFLMFINVPIWAMIMARLRRRLRGPGWMIGSMVVGAAGFALVPLANDWRWAMACVGAVGVMEGVVVYHALYYANTDPVSHSRSVGWIEGLAGSAFMAGPLAAGVLAGTTLGALSWRPYAAGTTLIVAMMIFTAVAHLRSRETGGHHPR